MGQTLDVIWVAVRAILQVFMVVGVGAVLTRMGYLGRETLQSLGKMSYYVFIPALAFYKICVGVRLEQLLDAWPFLVYPSIVAGLGFVVGIAVTRIFRVESKPLRHSIVVTCMFGNYGNLPLALLETITKDVWPFSEDAAATQRSLAYASIFLSTASLWLWTFGPWYIKISREDPNMTSSTESEEDASAAVEEQEAEDVNVVPLSLEEEEDSHSIPMKTITTSTSTLDSARGANPASLDAFQPRLPFRQRLVSRAQVIWQAILNSPIWSVLTPSTLGCIFAVLLLIMGPVHRLFFTPPVLVQNTSLAPITPSFSNDTFVPSSNTTVCSPIEATTTTEAKKPPLKFVADSIGSLANICVPVSLLMLGSNLFTTVKGQIMRARLQRENNGANGDSSSGSATQSVLPLSKRVLFGAVFGRLAVLPAVCFAFTWLVHKTGILPADPLVSVILAVEGCMPSAINLIILAQLQDDQLVVEQLSTILLVQYLFCTFSIFTTIALGIQMFT